MSLRASGGGGLARLKVSSNRTSGKAAVGDILTIVVPAGFEATDYNFTIDRGAGFVPLSTGSATYTLQAADIPDEGEDYPVIGRAVLGSLVSPNFGITNPIYPVTTVNSTSILGDSINAYGDFALSGTTGGQTSLSHIGIINDIERLAGRPGFDIIGFHAVGGTTAQTCLSVQVPQAIASPSRIAIVHTGVNSYNDTITSGQGGPFTQAQILTVMGNIIAQLAAAKDLVYIDAIHPVSQSGTTGAKARSGEFRAHNAAVEAMCALYTNVRFLNSYDIFVDPGSGQDNPLPNLIQTVDGIHQTTQGARAWGEGIRATMMLGVTLIPYRVQGSNLVQPFGTTGGTATPGSGSIIGTASIPLGWNVQVISGSAAVTVSNPTADVVRLSITNAGGAASTVYLQYTQTAALFAALRPGDVIQAGIDFSVVSATLLTRVAVTTRENGGNPLWNAMARDTTLETDAVLKYDQSAYSGRRWVHPRTLPPTLSGMELLIAVNVGPTTGAVVIDYSNPIFKTLN